MSSQTAILPIIVTISVSGFLEYFSNEKYNVITFVFYIFLCISYPQFMYLLPLIFYDLLLTKMQYFIVLSLLPIIFYHNYFSTNTILFLVIISLVEVILKYKAIQYRTTYKSYISQRDNLRELSMNLENKIRELTDKQDEEVSLATLNERNRIAREIHDNVGHLLTSSIIQIGAIIATTQEEKTKKNLETVKETLNDGMNSIRNSVHDLRDNSVDLHMQLKKLVDNFTFCEATLKFESTTTFSIKAKYAIISIIKEALNNVIKHSNATKVTINIYEHPKILQLIIIDNGSNMKTTNENGMGIEGIKQRVDSLNGNINIENSMGFKIFISFNKEDIS